MQIVIKIPEELYKAILNGLRSAEIWNFRLAVKNGIVLPTGHGRLIDADALMDTLGASDGDIYAKACIEEDAPTIIEADGDVHRIIHEENVDDATTIIEADDDISSYPSSTITESHYTGSKYYAYWCPNCSKNVDKLTSKYVCRYCGQKLKWEV